MVSGRNMNIGDDFRKNNGQWRAKSLKREAPGTLAMILGRNANPSTVKCGGPNRSVVKTAGKNWRT